MKDELVQRRVHIFASGERAIFARKRRACETDRSALGDSFVTVSSFLAEMWNVHGDERRLATNVDRDMLVLSRLRAQSEFAATIGSAKVISQFIRRYAGALDFEGGHAALSAAESSMLAFVRDYCEDLGRCGLVEPGCAARFLSERGVTCDAVVEDDVEIPVAVGAFVSRDEGGDRGGYGDGGVSSALRESVEVAFAFPAGISAVYPSICEELRAFCSKSGGDDSNARRVAVVFVADPAEALEVLAPDVCATGAECRAACKIGVARTALGRVMAAALEVVSSGPHWRTAVVDFAYSRFSGMPPYAARDLDERIRGDRLASCDAVRRELAEVSTTFSAFARFIERFDGESFDALLELIEEVFVYFGREKAREEAALAAFARIADKSRTLGVSVEVAFDLAMSASVAYEVRLAGSSDRIVEFRPLSQMGGLADGSVDLVVLGDVSDAAHPRTGPSALDSLAVKLGASAPQDSLVLQRAAFGRALGAATSRVVCVFPLSGPAGEETYPAFFVDELAEALRGDADVKGKCPLPLSAEQDALVSRKGEDDLVACVGRRLDEPTAESVVEQRPRGSLRPSCREVAPMKRDSSGEEVVVLSPSALETYIECPYRWFVERRIGLHEIDERFGPAEKGSFVHEAMAAVFDRLADQGVVRVDGGNIDYVLACAEVIVDEAIAAQSDRDVNRLAAVTGAEHLEVGMLRAQVLDTLKRLARMPEGYDVFCHEMAIGIEDGVEYAGARLVGRIDRVDVDRESRRFVVLDYKGSITGYSAGVSDDEGPDIDLPHKIQALMYAQAFRRMHADYACAGALYLSYRARSDGEFAAGSYDEGAYDVGRMTKKSSLVKMNFDSFLDSVEEGVRPYVDALESGDIAVRPRSKSSCTWCSVGRCEGRL